MIVHDVEQGTQDWLDLRIGLPTASCLGKIITNTGKISKQSESYAAQLAAEFVLGRSLDKDLSNIDAVQHGREFEDQAALAYEFEFGVTTQKVGFITNDEKTFGVSPDRLVGGDGLIEIKCPEPQIHALYMTRGFGVNYYAQVQGQLLVTEREWNDRLSYSDELPMYCERTYRNEEYIKNLGQALKDFHEIKMEMIDKIQKSINGISIQDMPA